jgi:hypothetical protein
MNMRSAQSRAMTSRNLGLSQKLYLLVIPNTALVGDLILAFPGGKALYILRSTKQNKSQYRFIGECYAHGLMDGKIRRMIQLGEANVESISLI